MTEKEKMLLQMPYSALDPEIQRLQMEAKKLTYALNMMDPADVQGRKDILKKLLGQYNGRGYLGANFQCDLGFQIFIQGMAVINYNCVMLDTAPIIIGNNVYIGPGTCLSCASHPIVAQERNTGVNTAKEIVIKNNVWIGANCTVLGGTVIGEGSVIGAGSVVNKDVPAGVIAAGVPCKVIREICDDDRLNL